MHEDLAIRMVVAVSLRETPVDAATELLNLDSTQLILLHHQANALADHFARGIVPAGLDLILDNLLEFGGKVNVHALNLGADVQVCQCWTGEVGVAFVWVSLRRQIATVNASLVEIRFLPDMNRAPEIGRGEPAIRRLFVSRRFPDLSA